MAAILDKYAIKEVADVMFYELDSKGAPSAPVIYFDTLKVSTISQSSEKVEARGGKSNVKLLTWDTNKEITLELEDAVFSAKSLGIMFGGDMTWKGDELEVLKTLEAKYVELVKNTDDILQLTLGTKTLYIDAKNVSAFSYADDTGAEQVNPIAIPHESINWGSMTGAVSTQEIEFVTFNLLDCTAKQDDAESGYGTSVMKNGLRIDIGAEFDSNTYYITGDTYARNLASGRDEFLQFIIPKGKVSAEDVSITMEADGDPATFSMTVDCLKSAKGYMLQFVKYSFDEGDGAGDGKNKGVASVMSEFDYGESSEMWADPASIADRA